MGLVCSYGVIGKFIGKDVCIIQDKMIFNIEILTAENGHICLPWSYVTFWYFFLTNFYDNACVLGVNGVEYNTKWGSIC